jgi:hypothetical protein
MEPVDTSRPEPRALPDQGLSAAARNKLIITIAILAVANYLLTVTHTPAGPITHLDGSVAQAHEVQRATLMSLFITIPILGFILGALVSVFPFRGWTYGQKYLGASLLCVMGIHGLLFVGSLIALGFL